MRLCLSLEVVPVFTPPREMGFQAMIAGYNGWWQAKVGARFHHAALGDWPECSGRFVAALRQRRAARFAAAPSRRPFPQDGRLDLPAHPQGQLVDLRRTDEAGRVEVLGHPIVADPRWL